MRAIRYTVWVLCAFIVSVTLDSVPDPPAIKNSYRFDTQAKPSGDQAEPLALHLNCDRPAALAWSDVRWRALDQLSTVNRSADRPAAVWRFADTSPPIPTIL